MESVWKSLRGDGPVWLMVGSFLVVAVIILVWGVDRGGPDTTPPAPEVVSASGTVGWEGGDCIDLERWTGSEWERLAYASYGDATKGVWGPPTNGERFCNLVGVLEGSVSLPAEARPGTYRVCNIGVEPDCVELEYFPE